VALGDDGAYPPTAKARFDERTSAPCRYLALINDPVVAHVPELGLYNSLGPTGPHTAVHPYPPTASTRPFVNLTNFGCSLRWYAMFPVAVHNGSSTAGYTTGDPAHEMITRHEAAPGATKVRPQGARGSRSTAHPSTVTRAGCRVFEESTTTGGAMRKRGAPPLSRNSSTVPI
jgi:hypothetical protein